MSNFDTAFKIVIGEEGGYQSPAQAVARKDPGGETKFGICKRDHPDVDIKNLTIDGAKAIYKPEYWDAIKGDQIPYPLCTYAFDACVNQGADATKKLLQKTFNQPQDGILGVKTMAAIAKATPWHMHRFMAFRSMRYMGTRNFDIDGEGWLTRLFSVTEEAAKNG